MPPHIRTLADRLRRELDHVDRLLESFLTLAHSQQGPPGDESTVSLAELARVAIERRADAISAMGLDVEQQQRPDAWVTGSETLLARMVENVIDNAIGHNQPGGWVRVTTAVEGKRARLVVENGGPVLDPDQVEQLTQPFRRIGAERTGSDNGAGLGLAIVSSIVEVHGGTLDLEALPDGGLRVTITLPARGQDSSRSAGVRVLVVEDSRTLADALVEGLQDEGMAVDVAYDGLQAATKLDLNSYDVVVLDRDLPGLHGDTVCRMITERENPAMVLMLTAVRHPGATRQRPQPRSRRLPPKAVPLPRARAPHPRPRPPPTHRPSPASSAQPESNSTRSTTPPPATDDGSTSQPRNSRYSRP